MASLVRRRVHTYYSAWCGGIKSSQGAHPRPLCRQKTEPKRLDDSEQGAGHFPSQSLLKGAPPHLVPITEELSALVVSFLAQSPREKTPREQLQTKHSY